MKRLLALPRYTEAGPSSRYRTYQFLPYFQEQGWDVTVRPLLGDAYVRDLYAGRRWGLGRVLPCLASRVRDLARGSRYDALLIEKECLPWLSSLPERLLARMGVPFAVDYDDAIFHIYDQHPSAIVRCIYGGKIRRVMATADMVVAGNAYLAEWAHMAGARRVEILPTVVDLQKYPEPVARGPEMRALARIGWIGSPITEDYLQEVAGALAEVAARTPIELTVIGASEGFSLPGVPIRRVAWSEATEVSTLASCDIGIMPLRDEPWFWGKCGFKLIQYMGVGLPVVASPIGVNRDLVAHGASGFLARTRAEWVESLMSLITDGRLRAAMGREGRRLMTSKYTIQAVAPRLEFLLGSLAGEVAERPARGGT